MAKSCVFCGGRPEDKNKEHVIPRWLIEATGDPKREASFGTYNWKTKLPKKFAFDQLTFPACSRCNSDFSGLEARAKGAVQTLQEMGPLGADDFNVLLDWLDKVRIGMWLGLMQLEGNPWGIEPKFHISQRVALHDRSVGVGVIEQRGPGINLVGPESPCFGFSPTTMCILINKIILFNSSATGLCSRRLGFPFLTEYAPREDGLLEGRLVPGLERVLRPVERLGYQPPVPFLYQPIIERGLNSRDASAPDGEFYTDYVRENCLDFEKGLGSVFLQRPESILKYGSGPSRDWVPDRPLSFRDAYRAGRRWVYKKLELHHSAEASAENPMRGSFGNFHERLIRLHEREMGF